ncbi:MAG: type II 3-dehydroquinate dehydratase [Oscillospiraceae bacterium]|nr:type II 3-dehydroquinate dehydratase [Oscillospiraceae bacterium]
MKLLVVNGPNLNLLGTREPDVYGHGSYSELTGLIAAHASENNIGADVVQYNGEGDLIDAIQGAAGRYDGLIINPGALTHYSYAVHDALKAVPIDAVEVHISNISAREEFRNRSVTAPACIGQISGLGFYGYVAAMDYFIKRDV